MKAVVVDLSGSQAVILRDDGCFEKIKNNNYVIGQEISLQPRVIHFPKQAAVAASLALVLFGCGGLGTYAWMNPVSYVSLDINPSISYSLNEFNRVIAVDGMNDEGEAIVDAIGNSLKNRDLTTALTITVEQLSTEAYLDADNINYMVIGVYSDKDSKADALMSTVDAFSAATVDVCSITTVNVSPELKETADSYGITGGKMALIHEITTVASDSDKVDPSVLAELTVAELEQTKEAAESGASLADAVAAASPDNTGIPVPTAEPTDSAAVASESKPEESTGDADSSSAKKDTAESKPTAVASDTAIGSKDKDGKEPAAADNTASANNGAASTDKNGTSSSDKKNNDKQDNPDSDSDKKGETISSESKGESSSSPSKGETTSSESKDQVTEDDSPQTNSDLDSMLPVVSNEIAPELPSDDEDDEIDTIGIPS